MNEGLRTHRGALYFRSRATQEGVAMIRIVVTKTVRDSIYMRH